MSLSTMLALLASFASSALIRPPLVGISRGCALRGKDRCDRFVMRSVADGVPTAELKSQLIDSAARFREAQQERWAQEEAASAATTFELGREGDDTSQQGERLKSPLAAEGFGNVEIDLDKRLSELSSGFSRIRSSMLPSPMSSSLR